MNVLLVSVFKWTCY